MQSFLEISDYSAETLRKILNTIDSYAKNNTTWPVINKPIASLFYEDSTRTRVSFELAALNLGMSFIQVDIKNSSENKGEELLDTINTLHAMGINDFIVRHKDPKLIHTLDQSIKTASFINAGSGMYAHPTQALLDLYTMMERIDDLSQAKVVIAGDIKHSRVASSLITGLTILGVGEIVCSSPSYFTPSTTNQLVTVEENLDKALIDADVVVALRVQKERLSDDINLSLSDFQANYRLCEQKLTVAKPDVFIMHPGPMNRDVEITSSLADSSKSVILEQVRNGVFARMAVMSLLDKERG